MGALAALVARRSPARLPAGRARRPGRRRTGRDPGRLPAYGEGTPFPGVAALLPVLGTAAVLVAGPGGTPSEPWPVRAPRAPTAAGRGRLVLLALPVALAAAADPGAALRREADRRGRPPPRSRRPSSWPGSPTASSRPRCAVPAAARPPGAAALPGLGRPRAGRRPRLAQLCPGQHRGRRPRDHGRTTPGCATTAGRGQRRRHDRARPGLGRGRAQQAPGARRAGARPRGAAQTTSRPWATATTASRPCGASVPRGDPEGDKVVAVLGNSHGRMWIPAFEEIAGRRATAPTTSSSPTARPPTCW